MGCSSCGSGCGSSGGCGKPGNTSGGGCATGGCNKLNSYNWFGHMQQPGSPEMNAVYEIRFKNTRKGFYRNVNCLRLYAGDWVLVEAERGHDLGQVALTGVMADLQMRKKGYSFKHPDEVPRIFRKANDQDLEQLTQLRSEEHAALVQARRIVQDLNLDMKVAEVEYQGDGSKITFFYTAEHRVDFRELIRLMGRVFHMRIDMRQINPRQEAGMVGGIGVCGRELCCATWLTEFKTVGTAAARYQNLSLNPMKITGQCGRLKCCLNFELDMYMEAMAHFPRVEKLYTQRGSAYLQKTDIFKGLMWFSYSNESAWYALTPQQVKEIQAQIKEGNKPESLQELAPPIEAAKTPGNDFDFVDVVGQIDLADVESLRMGGGRERRKAKLKRPQAPAGPNPARPPKPAVQHAPDPDDPAQPPTIPGDPEAPKPKAKRKKKKKRPANAAPADAAPSPGQPTGLPSEAPGTDASADAPVAKPKPKKRNRKRPPKPPVDGGGAPA